MSNVISLTARKNKEESPHVNVIGFNEHIYNLDIPVTARLDLIRGDVFNDVAESDIYIVPLLTLCDLINVSIAGVHFDHRYKVVLDVLQQRENANNWVVNMIVVYRNRLIEYTKSLYDPEAVPKSLIQVSVELLEKDHTCPEELLTVDYTSDNPIVPKVGHISVAPAKEDTNWGDKAEMVMNNVVGYVMRNSGSAIYTRGIDTNKNAFVCSLPYSQDKYISITATVLAEISADD